MDLIGLLLTLIILACVLWIAAKILDLALAESGLPPQVKPIVLGLVLLIGILMIFRGHYIRF